MDLITYALAKKYIKASLAGAGALKGDKGDPGQSAYELAVKNGFSGSEAEWIAGLAGTPGETPYIGANGNGHSPGTKHMIKTMKKLGKPVRVVNFNGQGQNKI